jgi:uncharacterized protein (DUF488 family)
MEVFTVGHSNRSQDERLDVLRGAEIAAVADVRRYPGSRRHPHFGGEALAAWLPAAGVDYVHLGGLGGRRRPLPDTVNDGWEVEQFRGYADHLGSADFGEALGALEDLARRRRTAVMCAEAQWWRCHRRMVADALLVRGWRVLHLGLGGAPAEHVLTPFAVAEGTRLTYPAPQTALEL